MGRVKVDELYPLADALYMELSVANAGTSLKGENKIKIDYPQLADLVCNFTLKIVESAVCQSGLAIALLMKGPGQLLLLAYHDLVEDQLYAAIMESKSLQAKPLKPSNVDSFSAALEAVALPYKAIYKRDAKSKTGVWSEYKPT